MNEKLITFFYKDQVIAKASMSLIPQVGQIIDFSIECKDGFKKVEELEVVRVKSFLEIYLDKSCDDSYLCFLEKDEREEHRCKTCGEKIEEGKLYCNEGCLPF